MEHLTEYKNTANRSEYTKLFNQAKRGLKSLQSAFSTQLESAPTSIISGSSSLDFIFNHNMTRVKEIEQVVSQVQSEDISRGDVFIGPVGIGLMLASFSETPNQILENLDHIIRNDSPQICCLVMD